MKTKSPSKNNNNNVVLAANTAGSTPQTPLAQDTSKLPQPNHSDPDQEAASAAIRSISAAAVERRFRSKSFAAGLTSVQFALLWAWLEDKNLSIDQVREKIAAPPPEGFGLKVHANTLYRLKLQLRNFHLHRRVQESLDTAADVLLDQPDTSVAPVRQALISVLYSRAMDIAATNGDTKLLGQVLSAIQKLEKLRPVRFSPQPQRAIDPPVTRHRVELSILQQPAAPLVNISTESVPDSPRS